MFGSTTKKLTALLLVVCLAFSLVACGATTTEEEQDKLYCSAGGDIVLPEEMEIPGGNNEMTKQLIEGQNILAGAFSLTNYRSSGYYNISGDSVTVTVNASLDHTTKYTDATFTLWERGENYAEYKTVIYFAADGTTQSYTFSGLDPAKQYKINFTYTTVGSYLMTGTFNINGFSATSGEDVNIVAE